MEHGVVRHRSCPSPSADHAGSGMHTHFSLFEGDTNAFYEPGSQYQLSKVGGRSWPACCATRARSAP